VAASLTTPIYPAIIPSNVRWKRDSGYYYNCMKHENLDVINEHTPFTKYHETVLNAHIHSYRGGLYRCCLPILTADRPIHSPSKLCTKVAEYIAHFRVQVPLFPCLHSR